jgi:DNA-binding response OmpR family regulator
MMLASLLLSRDPAVISILQPALEALAIDVEICHDPDLGMQTISAARFDAVIIDCDDMEGGLAILEGLRRANSCRSSVALALLNGGTTTQEAFDLGASFVLQKPISALNAMRCCSAALGAMQREQRRYFRYPIEIGVTLALELGGKVKGKTTNISEGGMAIRLATLAADLRVESISFSLPGSELAIETKVRLAWADGAGRVGARFLDMAPAAKELLNRWLFEAMAKLA